LTGLSQQNCVANRQQCREQSTRFANKTEENQKQIANIEMRPGYLCQLYKAIHTKNTENA
jgi:hypothetical protein